MNKKDLINGYIIGEIFYISGTLIILFKFDLITSIGFMLFGTGIALLTLMITYKNFIMKGSDKNSCTNKEYKKAIKDLTSPMKLREQNK